MKTTQSDQYFVRNSFFNLVELSLLARLYEEFCSLGARGGKLNQDSLAQTLLKMKATENSGVLRVAIYDADIVGFFWQDGQKVLAHWVHADHQGKGVEQILLNN